jgi:hypothetical protein
VDGDARRRASDCGAAREGDAVGGDGERRNVPRARVGHEHEARVGRDHDRALRRQVRHAVSAAAGGMCGSGREAAVGRTLVDDDLVGVLIVRLGEGKARSVGVVHDVPFLTGFAARLRRSPIRYSAIAGLDALQFRV